MIVDLKKALFHIQHQSVRVAEKNPFSVGANEAWDISGVVRLWDFEQIVYSTQHDIIGILVFKSEALKSLIFFGYRCCDCDRVIFAPVIAQDLKGLSEVLQHDCRPLR